MCVCVCTPLSQMVPFSSKAGLLEPICLSSPTKLWQYPLELLNKRARNALKGSKNITATATTTATTPTTTPFATATASAAATARATATATTTTTSYYYYYY